MNPTPKEFYRENHKEESGLLGATLNEAWFQRAAFVAIANIAHGGATAEQVNGAKLLMSTLWAMCADETKLESFPDHSDLKTYK